MKGELDWQNAEILGQYMERDVFPKVMIYSTHQETVAPLLSAFENGLLTDPAPASSVFFHFFKYRSKGDEEGVMRQAVKVTFSETPWDLDTHKPLIFLDEQKGKGHSFISLDSFNSFVDNKISYWD